MPPRPPSSFSRFLLFRSFKNPNPQLPKPLTAQLLPFSTFSSPDNDDDYISFAAGNRILRELQVDIERDRNQEREARIRAGLDTKDIDAEEDEDYFGINLLIEKLEKEKLKPVSDALLYRYEEPTDSDSSEDEAQEEAAQRRKDDELIDLKLERHSSLIDGLLESQSLDEAYNWMSKIDRFEEKHFKLRVEYRVIGELMNRLKVAEGKEKFMLQQKLNRAVRLMQWKEKFDPNNPSNYGVIQREDSLGGPQEDELEKEKEERRESDDEDKETEDEDEDVSEDDEDDMGLLVDAEEQDRALLEKLHSIDKKLEEKLGQLEYTFGKKGRVLEEEIRELADERNALTKERRKPLYRKGFETRLIDLNRTCKVTKGGQLVRYTVILVCGNFNGVIGYAKARGPAVPTAFQKALEKCYQNLHYVERHEEHTIAHAVHTKYKKTKVYLWPAKTKTGMVAGRTVEAILHLAGFKNIKSKVIGSRNPHNTVKAVFQALNAIETPKDVQEKFGRAVVEKHLL